MSAQLPSTQTQKTQPNPQLIFWLSVLGVLLCLFVLAWVLPVLSNPFPENMYLGVRPRVDAWQDWITRNRTTSGLFVYFIEPLKQFIDSGVRRLEDALLALHWAIVVGVVTLLGWLLGRARLAVLCFVGFMALGLLGLWAQSMQTLALMLVSVFLALLIAIPIGIICAQSNTADRLLRPVLDTMQTMPTFVYLIPVVLFFGIARVPAVIATVIYAIPPAIRLTNFGIREVQPTAIEAGKAFGSTRAQLLGKILLPLALPSLLAGVNQTIMMALGMVVIAAMVGAGGLGREVFQSLQRLRVGQAFEAGLAIVMLAIVLDRLSEALGKIDLTNRIKKTVDKSQHRWLHHPRRDISLLIIALTVFAVIAFEDVFPAAWRVPINQPIDAAVKWLRDNVFFITGALSDFLVVYLLNPVRWLLRDGLPYSVVIALFGCVAYRLGNWKLALGTVLGFVLVGALGMWQPAMDTLSQVLVTMLVTMAVALPLGVLASQSEKARLLLRPILDFLQTVPTFVFLVPVIMLFNIGRVPGLIASVLYAIPVGIKLTELGIRQVPPETVEAARAFGSTRGQIIRKVQLPLARNAIALSINQMIMLVLAMVVISGMVGGAGLGLLAVEGLAKNATGQGIEAGIAIVVIAIVLDRLTQAWAKWE